MILHNVVTTPTIVVTSGLLQIVIRELGTLCNLEAALSVVCNAGLSVWAFSDNPFHSHGNIPNLKVIPSKKKL